MRFKTYEVEGQGKHQINNSNEGEAGNNETRKFLGIFHRLLNCKNCAASFISPSSHAHEDSSILDIVIYVGSASTLFTRD